MSAHVTALCRSGFFQLGQLCLFTRSLTVEAAKTLVRAFVSYHLDYCNSLLYGVTDNVVRRVQSLQNAAARLITGARRRDHITPACAMSTTLASCSAASGVQTRLRHALCGQMPIYLADDIHLVSEGNRRSLRSSSDNMCAVYHVRATTASETEALVLSAREFGTVCRAAYRHLTSATNI